LCNHRYLLTALRVTRLDPEKPVASPGPRAPRATPSGVLATVLVCFALLSAAVLSLTPPWEANDEPDHVQNVETLVSGHWYRITPHSNLESFQAPLYYLALALYQKLVRQPVHNPDGQLAPIADNQQHGNFVHTVPQDGVDQRLVDLLRLPSIVFGLIAIVATYVAAKRVSRDRWTPVVAAAIVAGVPKFVFVSGTVNNDNLSNALGGVGLAGALVMLASSTITSRRRMAAAAGLGLVAGALILTKVTAGLLAPGLLLAVILRASSVKDIIRQCLIFAIAALAVVGWWLVQNQIWYGDPLALHATNVHQREVFPAVLNVAGPLHRIFVDVPRDFYSSFWYDSGWNQFTWRWFWYVPFWGLAALGVAGLVLIRRVGPRVASRAPIAVTALLAFGALCSVWIVGIPTNTEQGRYAFMGLPAIAVLLALGYERLRMPPIARFILPAIGLIGTVLAIRYHVIIPYLVR